MMSPRENNISPLPPYPRLHYWTVRIHRRAGYDHVTVWLSRCREFCRNWAPRNRLRSLIRSRALVETSPVKISRLRTRDALAGITRLANETGARTTIKRSPSTIDLSDYIADWFGSTALAANDRYR